MQTKPHEPSHPILVIHGVILAIVFDLDDTFWTWRNAYSAGLVAMENLLFKRLAFKTPNQDEAIRTIIHEHLGVAMISTSYYEHPAHNLPSLFASIDAKHPHLLPTSRIEREQLIRDLDRTYAEAFDAENKLHEDALHLLEELKVRKIRLAAYTNAHLDKAVHRLRRNRIGKHFDLIAGRTPDRIPDEHQRRTISIIEGWNAIAISLPDEECKPHKPTLERIAKTLGVDLKNCLHVGDSALDIDPAAELGAPTLHAIGYNNPSDHAVEHLTRLTLHRVHHPTRPHRQINRLKEVLDHI